MRKRILSILGACLVLASVFALFVVPVGASEADGHDTYVSPITFEYVSSDGNGEFMPWALNVVSPSLPNWDIQLPGGSFDCLVYSYDFLRTAVVCDVRYAGDDKIYFCSESPQYIKTGADLNSFEFSALYDTEPGFVIESVNISFTLLEKSTYGVTDQKYGFSYRSLSQTFFPNSNGTANIGYWLSYMLVSENSSFNYFLIDNLVVTVDIMRTGVNTPLFVFYSDFSSFDTLDCPSQWMAERNFVVSVPAPISPDDVNLFEWLLNGAEAFMNFEIGPGLSIKAIITFVLVVGLLLWFIKLLS